MDQLFEFALSFRGEIVLFISSFLAIIVLFYSFIRQFNHDKAPIEECSGGFGQKNRIQPSPNLKRPKYAYEVDPLVTSDQILQYKPGVMNLRQEFKHARQMRGKKVRTESYAIEHKT